MRKTNIILMLLILSALTFMVYATNMILKYPFIGVVVKEEHNKLIITEVYPGSWSEAVKLEKGLIIEEIDGKDPNLHPSVRLYGHIEKANNIKFIRDNKLININIEYSVIKQQIIYHIILPILLFIVCVVTSIYLYVYKKSKDAKILVSFLNLLGISYMAAVSSARKDILSDIIVSIIFVNLLMLLLHFFVVFYKGKQMIFLQNRYLNVLYVATVFELIISVVFRYKYNHFTVKLDLYYFTFLLLLTFSLLIWSQIKMAYTNYKKINKILIVNLFLSLIPFLLLFLVPQIIFGDFIVKPEYIAIFLIIIPFGFLYLFVGEMLFDIEFIMRRVHYYMLLSFCLTIIIVVLALLIYPIPDVQVLNLFLFGFCVFLLIFLFLYAKVFLDFKVRREFHYQERYYQASLHRFLKYIRKQYNLNDIIIGIKKEITGYLNIEDIGAYEVILGNSNIHIINNEYLVKKMVKGVSRIHKKEHNVGNIIKIRGGFCLVISKIERKQLIIMCKCKKYRLNIDELMWLGSLASYAALVIESLDKIENLVSKSNIKDNSIWFSRLQFKIAEKERSNLARDIHDGVLQDQLRLSKKIELYKEKYRDKEITHIFNKLNEELLDNIYIIRETCNTLHPPFLEETGLIEALVNLFRKFNLTSSFFLEYNMDNSLEIQDMELKRGIYRIIQELLNNAIKHSNAKNVNIDLFGKGKKIYLNYRDKGIGMNLHESKHSSVTMGINGMIARTESLGGEFFITSELDQGVLVKISFLNP
ncbi:histidine kinase [Bacillus sp. ZJS3]|uniref:sensor histidine kinase n=1 Tax=Bacillus sp. ZJS3 TaxID=2928154 RepID=UPI001FB418C2|nr:ATP-binding protein [Bacillus sp. ZJS3]UOB79043.1 histidine kinase [Bacillus sp. ZJS3]